MSGRDAVFTRKKTEDGDVEFVVTPAPQSMGLVALAWIFVFVVCGTLVVVSSNQHGSGKLALILIAIGVLVVFLRAIIKDSTARSTEITLRVSQTHLNVGGQDYALDDIAELRLVDPQGEERARSTMVVGGTGGVAGGAALGAAAGVAVAFSVVDSVGQEQVARSFSLALRRRSHSAPVTIVRYLTVESGETLLKDISDAIRTTSHQTPPTIRS